jgi:hypothetical protein
MARILIAANEESGTTFLKRCENYSVKRGRDDEFVLVSTSVQVIARLEKEKFDGLILQYHLGAKSLEIAEVASFRDKNEKMLIAIIVPSSMKGGSYLNSLLYQNILGAVYEEDAKISLLLSLMQEPRGRKEAELYYGIFTPEVTTKDEVNSISPYATSKKVVEQAFQYLAHGEDKPIKERFEHILGLPNEISFTDLCTIVLKAGEVDSGIIDELRKYPQFESYLPVVKKEEPKKKEGVFGKLFGKKKKGDDEEVPEPKKAVSEKVTEEKPEEPKKETPVAEPVVKENAKTEERPEPKEEKSKEESKPSGEIASLNDFFGMPGMMVGGSQPAETKKSSENKKSDNEDNNANRDNASNNYNNNNNRNSGTDNRNINQDNNKKQFDPNSEKARLEAEQKKRLNEERIQREEKLREEARKDAERQAALEREKAQQREAELKAQAEAAKKEAEERIAQSAKELAEKAEAERKALEQQSLAEMKAIEEQKNAELRAKDEAVRKAKEEAERKAKADAERIAAAEREKERLAKEKEENEKRLLKEKADAERKAKEEAERIKAEAEKKAKADAERLKAEMEKQIQMAQAEAEAAKKQAEKKAKEAEIRAQKAEANVRVVVQKQLVSRSVVGIFGLYKGFDSVPVAVQLAKTLSQYEPVTYIEVPRSSEGAYTRLELGKLVGTSFKSVPHMIQKGDADFSSVRNIYGDINWFVANDSYGEVKYTYQSVAAMVNGTSDNVILETGKTLEQARKEGLLNLCTKAIIVLDHEEEERYTSRIRDEVDSLENSDIEPYVLSVSEKGNEVSSLSTDVLISPVKRPKKTAVMELDIRNNEKSKLFIYFGLENAPVMKRKKQSVKIEFMGTRDVAVFGAERGNGVTHTCLMLATSVRRDYKTAIVELNPTKHMEALAKELGQTDTPNKMNLNGIDIYYNMSWQQFSEAYRSNYQVVIIDFGTYTNAFGKQKNGQSYRQLTVSCAKKYLVFDASPWRLSVLDKMVPLMDGDTDPNCQIEMLAPMTDKKDLKNYNLYERVGHREIHLLPNENIPVKFSQDATNEIMRQLILSKV